MSIDNPNKEKYEQGFVTELESDAFPAGLNEDIVRKISAIKEEPRMVIRI